MLILRNFRQAPKVYTYGAESTLFRNSAWHLPCEDLNAAAARCERL